MSKRKISLEQVRQVAKLARIEMNESELERTAEQLETILEYVALIDELDLDRVEPLAHALSMSNVFRDDQIRPSLPLDQVLMNAPEIDGPFFKVPKIIGGGEEA